MEVEQEEGRCQEEGSVDPAIEVMFGWVLVDS